MIVTEGPLSVGAFDVCVPAHVASRISAAIFLASRFRINIWRSVRSVAKNYVYLSDTLVNV